MNEAGGWIGKLTLAFERAELDTRLVRNEHEGPLRIQRVFHPEGAELPHVYLLHPPGGVVGGDRLRARLLLGERTAVLITTPAAQKLYRSAGATARIDHDISVAEGARLEWLPSETLAFAGARAESRTRVQLAPGAAFIGWEISCFGMPACNEPFGYGRVSSRFELYRGEQPLLIEALDFAPMEQALDGAFALRGQPVMANLYAVPAASGVATDLVDALRRALEDLPGGTFGVSSLEDVLVVRSLAPSVEAARAGLVRAWQLLRPALLNRAAVVPRIWAT